MLFVIQWISSGEVLHAVVSKAITAELLGIGVEHYVVASLGNEESIIGEATRRREVEHENQIATAEGKHLIAVVVPNLLNGGLIEFLLALDHLEHLMVEIA